jgi:hypothetical protein
MSSNTTIPTMLPTYVPSNFLYISPTAVPKEMLIESTILDLANLTIAQGFKMFGSNAYDSSGFSVSSAGDFNGDGYADVIIGAYNASPLDRTSAGISYVIFGQATAFSNIDLTSLSVTQVFAIYGSNAGDGSGHSVSGAGD